VSLQTLHYLTLCIISPPLLAAFADTASLNYEGGATSVGMLHEPLLPPFGFTEFQGMIMDWREMAGRPTVVEVPIGERWWAWRGGKKVGYGWTEDLWDGTMDHQTRLDHCFLLDCSLFCGVCIKRLLSAIRLIPTKQHLLPL
jgi:hypothetical protein